MSKHTPGPWTAQKDIRSQNLGKRPWNPDDPDTCDWAVYGPNLRIACLECAMDGRTENEQAGNARLIAAAPELLEALKCIVYADDSQVPLSADNLAQRCHMTLGAAERAIAAIAKAEDR